MNVEPPKELLKPLQLPQRILMGPGPSNCSQRVLQALHQQVLGHMHPEVFQLMDEIKAGLRYAFQTVNKLTLAISASGHSGMEASIGNILERDENILIVRSGLWGERAADIATRLGIRVDFLEMPLGVAFTLDELEEAVKKYQPKAVFVVHSESSTGLKQPLEGVGKEVQQKLIDDHFLFKEGDRFLQAANACRFWPTGRGIFHNDAKTFLVWCNEEDHLRIISMQMGGDLGQVYRRLVTAVNDIEKRLPFSHNERFGFLTFCPTNLGTTVRASVHIKVPKLAANKAKLEEVAAKFNLQVRGTRGEHTEAEGGIYDISNKRRLGLTEYQAVKEMHDGIAELIKIEKEL